MLFADFWALRAAGMWMALRARRQQRAVLGALARVMIAPWAGIFLLVVSVNIIAGSEEVGAFLIACWFVGAIFNNLVVWGRARWNLEQGLRYWVSEGKAGSARPWAAVSRA